MIGRVEQTLLPAQNPNRMLSVPADVQRPGHCISHNGPINDPPVLN